MAHKPVSKEWIAFSRLRGSLENYKSMSLIPPSQTLLLQRGHPRRRQDRHRGALKNIFGGGSGTEGVEISISAPIWIFKDPILGIAIQDILNKECKLNVACCPDGPRQCKQRLDWGQPGLRRTWKLA
ncbi:hypothetical protein KXV73_006713, partial [Aspergillus fumigatus]